MSDRVAPDVLHRGIKVPLAEFGPDILQSDLLPGSDGVDEKGRRIVADGNEWGVYMSTNPHLAQTYSSPRHGDPMPGVPSFNWRMSAESRLTVPRVGIQYEIASSGLPGLRQPQLQTFDHNNGFAGDEWIVDVVPKGAHRVTALRLGEDTISAVQRIDLSRGVEAALAKLEEKATARMARLAIARERIEEIPEDRRRNPGVVDRALQDLVIHRY